VRLRAVKKPFSGKTLREYSAPWLEARMDDLTRDILHIIETSCFTCGLTKELQVGHLFERRHRHTRWDVHEKGNNHLQCPNCNYKHEEKPEKYQDMYKRRFGEEAYAELDARAHSRMKIEYIDLFEKWEQMKAQLRQLQGKAA